ncbi:hypothetical protein KSK37_12120 [Kaistella sp. DKR-2]|uniref:hypothetical protein n=1 Tax=Kaistella soli TaxID=2849654 RepID=UPI001C25FF7A|nr:hypothetical protein [Kaistella soli]MBU8883833.1 hypothetical protein [Kaistella soli]
MKNISIGVLFLFGILTINGQEIKTLWQKDLQSSTRDFLTAMTSTQDRQMLPAGRSVKTIAAFRWSVRGEQRLVSQDTNI